MLEKDYVGQNTSELLTEVATSGMAAVLLLQDLSLHHSSDK